MLEKCNGCVCSTVNQHACLFDGVWRSFEENSGFEGMRKSWHCGTHGSRAEEEKT